MKVELKYSWLPNSIKGFDTQVKNLVETYVCEELFSSLDLENGGKILEQLLQDFPQKKDYIEQQTHAYKAFRRSHCINSPYMIECNVSFLSIKNSEGEWEDWLDESDKHETYENFREFVLYLKDNYPNDWKKELSEYELKPLSTE